MEYSQHTAQSKQPASNKILTAEHLYTTLLQDNIDHKYSSPGKGRDSVKLTALSTAIPETPRTKRELNF